MRSKPPSSTGSPGPRRGPPRDRHSGPRPSRPPDPTKADAKQHARLKPRPAAASTRDIPAREVPAREVPRAPGPDTLRAPLPAPPPAAARPATTEPAAPRVRGAATPHGTVWIHGTHAVAAALANPARRIKRLVLTAEAEEALRARFPNALPAEVERVERARLDAMLGRDTVHQGAALLADHLSPPSLAAVLARPGPLLVLDQVTDPRNIGAVLRSAAAFGAAGLVLQERHAPEETGVMAKAASGALEIVPVLRAVNLARTLAALKAAGFWTVGLQADAPVLRGAALAERRVALVLGAEGEGMRRLVRESCDELAGLAMPGGMESLNVSAAAAVALYELVREG